MAVTADHVCHVSRARDKKIPAFLAVYFGLIDGCFTSFGVVIGLGACPELKNSVQIVR